MQRILASLSLGGLLLLAGCHSILPNFDKPGPDSVKGGKKDIVTSAMLVDYLNKNAERLKTVTCPQVHMTVAVGVTKLINFGLDGKIMAQQPRDFRLKANMPSGQSAVDMGSNKDEFWFWIKDPSSSDQSYQFFCSYQNFQAGKINNQMPMPPFQPDWIMETLGMCEYGPPERYQLREEGDKIKLIELVTSPKGQPLMKVIVFNRKPAKAPTPQVVAFLLLDQKTKSEICSAQIQSAQLVPINPKEAATLPNVMVLNWPEKRVRLTLRLENPVANQEVNNLAFVRQKMPGFPSVDLATGKLEAQPTSIKQAQGFSQK